MRSIAFNARVTECPTGTCPHPGRPAFCAVHSMKEQSKKHHLHPLEYSPHKSDEKSHMNALQSVEAVDANSTQKQTLLETTQPRCLLGHGLPSHEQCPVPQLTGETSVSDCPEMTDAAIVSLKSGIKAENISLKSQDISFVSTEVRHMQKMILTQPLAVILESPHKTPWNKTRN
ncbi:hypothetical protein HPG69_004112 [Diceros bicornis minor]|uniref:Uncharacterized protein n=1 Tax=Diceros bicornis minor TaxID=77932 RepID=A0A7J7E9F0_DICBM|nr:hypothetical protein HPG69_004112 [Diceros bicornis minor]